MNKYLLFYSPEDTERILTALDTMRGLEYQGSNPAESAEYQRLIEDTRRQLEKYKTPMPELTETEKARFDQDWLKFLASQFGITGNTAQMPEQEIEVRHIGWNGEIQIETHRDDRVKD